MGDDLTVGEAAQALGTSPQTVRALLRKGELQGRTRDWGTRQVWVPSRRGVEDFLSQYGRLDGHRRKRTSTSQSSDVSTPIAEPVVPQVSLDPPPPSSHEESTEVDPSPRRSRPRPFPLRPRGRATVVLALLAVPLLAGYAAARILPDALWFEELGQGDVFGRSVAAAAALYLGVGAIAAAVVAVNLAIAVRGTDLVASRIGPSLVVGVSLITGSLFAGAAARHWQTFLLWWHQQPFGVTDPLYGRDVGFFVFSLPVLMLISGWLFWLLGAAAVIVTVAYGLRGDLGLRPRRASFGAQQHFAVLAAAFLLALGWRWRLDQYALELRQPAPARGDTFSGADYVDVHVELPALSALIVTAVIVALICMAMPRIVRARSGRPTRRFVGVPLGLLVLLVGMATAVTPALVQRFAVDPHPFLAEQPFLARSIAATRHGLGLDTVDVRAYAPDGKFTAADFSPPSKNLANVSIWDTSLLESRMRQLVTDTSYYRPEQPTLDAVEVDGRRQLTVAGARELDLRPVSGRARGWNSDRLAYTHGLGLIRFSATDIEPNGGPRLMDAGLGLRQPRIYFGVFPHARVRGSGVPRFLESATPAAAEAPWVIVNSRRPEVDVPAAEGGPQAPYHYPGTGGIQLSTWFHRALFGLALSSKQVLLSDEVTSDSRILLHRDVRDRLHTLAPFVSWDSHPVPLAVNGRIVFVVDGYTTSPNYPYAQRVALGGSQVTYVRATVRATVDAFSGRTDLYLTDRSEPIARAWRDAFPTLFRPGTQLPAELRSRLRYPLDLFNAQATAYERFHTSRADLLASNADAWSRPLALSGPLEVAGDVDFDEDDEDDLRFTLRPGYVYAPVPGQSRPRVVLSTYYVPRRGQHLVASLGGWIDAYGRPRLTSRRLPRDPATLGPAQVSRLVFATPRVRNLLGLRNLEIRDVDTSSLDSVILGRPSLLFLSGGVVQIQSLYEGSRGPGAARMLGVTAFVDGRAGLGPDIGSAVRQALNKPPRVVVLPPEDSVIVGKDVELAFRVENAKRETVTVTSSEGREVDKELDVDDGRGTVRWTPSAVGEATIKVDVRGLDGTDVSSSTTVEVMSAPPSLAVKRPPRRAVVGRQVRIPFSIKKGVEASAEISTRAGVVFSRRYLIKNGRGVVEWTPTSAGPAVLVIRVTGQQEQTANETVRIAVSEPKPADPPTIRLNDVPRKAVVGRELRIEFKITRGVEAAAQISTRSGIVLSRRYVIEKGTGVLEWTPTSPGAATVTVDVRGEGGRVARATARIAVDAEPDEPEPPTVSVVGAPSVVPLGRVATITFRAEGCATAEVRIQNPAGQQQDWSVPCRAGEASIRWTPAILGRHLVTVAATGRGGTSRTTAAVTAQKPR